MKLIAELIAKEGLTPDKPRNQHKSVGVGAMTRELIEPFVRLVRLLDESVARPVLSPLIEREIHFRLLLSDQWPRLRQIAAVGGQSHRIARAIDWLKAKLHEPLRIDDLAAMAQMSTSSLHHHFKQLTGMSPPRYQKRMRLNKARRLMLNEGANAAAAAFNVGYESPSQFSRDCSRLFGAPPRRDVESLPAKLALRRPRVCRRGPDHQRPGELTPVSRVR